jgi:microcystin-dependent protein
MASPFLGTIQPFGFNFAPRGWAMCNGQILSIAQNTALFSLLGTTYGGNGQTTFALPDLRSRVPVHHGQGPGLSSYSLGQQAGQESVTLTVNDMPLHQHGVAATGTFATKNPGGQVPAPGGAYGSPPDATSMNAGMIQPTGGNQPHANIQPYLALNFCICIEGLFPSRN